NYLEDFQADGDGQMVAGGGDLLGATGYAFGGSQGFGQQVLVLRHLRCLVEQRGVGSGVKGLVETDRFYVAGIGNHIGHLLKLFEFTGHCHGSYCGVDVLCLLWGAIVVLIDPGRKARCPGRGGACQGAELAASRIAVTASSSTARPAPGLGAFSLSTRRKLRAPGIPW